MLKKRLIGLVVVKGNWAVQSFSYSRYLPLGKPEVIVENLDRWGVDEIVVISIDKSLKNDGPDFHLIQKLGKLNLTTPLTFGGGIRNAEDSLKIIELGADRLIVTDLISSNLLELEKISNLIGYQSIVVSLPIIKENNNYLIVNYITKNEISNKIIFSISSNNLCSEFMAVDYLNEGYQNSFDMEIVNFISKFKKPIIVFGGISENDQISKLLKMKSIVGIGIGNFLSYKENSVIEIKEKINSTFLRKT